MRMGRIAVVTAAACMVSISAFAQSSNKPSSSKAYKQSMTLTGCLMGESDYKHAQSGKANSAGAKADDEFVLVESGADSGSCTQAANGKAYRLVGKRTHDLKPFVGHRMEITGAFEEKRDAEVAAGEKKSKLPPEVTVNSFREVTASASAAPAPAAVTASAAPEPAPAPPAASPEPAPAAPVATEARNETPSQSLPTTASSLPLVGLIGLISLTAAFGLRLTRPRVS